MTELHVGLDVFRSQLREAIARDLEGARAAPAPPRRALRLGGALAGVAAAATAAVALSGGSTVQSADAAILRHIRSALTVPGAMILHERATVTASWGTAPYELWAQDVAPHSYHVLKWGHEGSGKTSTFDDPAAILRALVTSGQAVVSPTTFNGVAAYELTVTGASDRFLNGTAYVAQSDYYPLQIDTTADGGEQITFQTYEYLPATAANLALLTQPSS